MQIWTIRMNGVNLWELPKSPHPGVLYNDVIVPTSCKMTWKATKISIFFTLCFRPSIDHGMLYKVNSVMVPYTI